MTSTSLLEKRGRSKRERESPGLGGFVCPLLQNLLFLYGARQGSECTGGTCRGRVNGECYSVHRVHRVYKVLVSVCCYSMLCFQSVSHKARSNAGEEAFLSTFVNFATKCQHVFLHFVFPPWPWEPMRAGGGPAQLAGVSRGQLWTARASRGQLGPQGQQQQIML